MRFLLLLLILIVSCKNQKAENKPQTTPDLQPQPIVKKENPFDTLTYDKVIAYDYSGPVGELIIDNKGKLANTVVRKKQLSDTQIKNLVDIIKDSSSYGGEIVKCLDTYLGIIFYKQDKPVEHLSISLSCNYMISLLPLPFDRWFSEKGREKLSILCKELGFSHCIN